MADRFPSIEDIDAGQTGGNDGGFDLINDGGDTSDFLQRERAALGDAADQFAGPQDSSIPRASVQDGDDDLMGGGGQTDGGSDDIMNFQSSFPAIDTRNERVAPGGTITGGGTPFLPGLSSSAYAPPSSSSEPAEEPTVIKEWRERRSLAIQHREDAAAARKSATIKAAQEAVDDFYENYNNKKEKNIAQTRKEAETFLEKREDTSAGGTSWERIAKLVDVQKGGKASAAGAAAGKERFRELLVSLVKDENAPGAKGY